MKFTIKNMVALFVQVPLTLFGVTWTSVPTFLLYYLVIWCFFPKDFCAQHFLSWDYIFGVIFFFGTIVYLTQDFSAYIAKHLLGDSISKAKVYLFSLIVLLFNVAVCVFYNYILSSDDASKDVFYIRLVMVILLSMASVSLSCGNVIKKKNEEKLKLIEELKSEREKAVRAQLNMLKLQLDPHFMFNSLGTLSGIIVADPQKALDFTSRLARIYKYIVAHISDDTISLHSGMDFILDYCQHIEMRYKDNFVFEIDDHVWHDEEEMILPLSLQLLVENAVKHNQHSVEHPLHIRIYREEDFVCVSNRIVPYEEIGKTRVGSTGIGIKNLYDRYKLLTDRLPIVLQSATTYTVQIPIVREIKSENKHSLL